MPFTANRATSARRECSSPRKTCTITPPTAVRAPRRAAGLRCVNAGSHCRESITAAIREQAGVMDYAPPFQMGHPLASSSRSNRSNAARRHRSCLRQLRSEAVDTALKIALAYWQAKASHNAFASLAEHAAITVSGSAESPSAESRPIDASSRRRRCPPSITFRTHTTWRATLTRADAEHGVHC